MGVRDDGPHMRRRKYVAALGALAGTAGCLGRMVPDAFGGPADGGDPGSGGSAPTPFTDPDYAAGFTAEGAWRMDGGDPGRTGATDAPAPRGDVGVAWLRRAGSDASFTTAPVVDDGRVAVGYSEGTGENGVHDARVTAFDAGTGARGFDASIGRGRVAGLAFGDALYAATWRDGEGTSDLVAVAAKDGTERWRVRLPGVTGPPALADDRLHVATRQDDDAVYAFAPDGTRLWRHPVDGEAYTAPCVAGGTVSVGLADGRVVAVDAADGTGVWTAPVVDGDPCCPDIQGTPVAAGDRLYVPGIDERLYAVDAADGSVAWRATVVGEDYGNPVPSPAVADGAVYVNTHHGRLVALDAADGAVRWRSGDHGGLLPPVVGSDTVLAPVGGTVRAHDAGGERLWTVGMHVPDAGMAAYIMDPEPAVAHGLAYVALHDGRVYAVGAAE